MLSQFTAESSDAGARLDVFLVKKMPRYSRSQIKKLIKSGNIAVNGKSAAPHYAVKTGDKIEVNLAEEKTESEKIPQIEIVAETPEFIVINKPAGVVVHPDAKHKTGTIVDFLKSKYPDIIGISDLARPGIVHRLDKDASGLMVIARTRESFQNLKKQFQDRQIEKEYLVLVYDDNLPDAGEIIAPLSRSKKSGKIVARSQFSGEAKSAHTIYKTLERRKNFALALVQTKTGRTHQIRVHFHSIGHSAAGDNFYKQKRTKGKLAPVRLFLHATRLAFFDLAGKKNEYQIPLPSDLQKFWDQLK